MEWPPYAYVPGHRPHPTRHPDGHGYGRPEPAVSRLDPARWRDNEAFMRGVALFDRGYYWEAHERWEGLWIAEQRRGPVARVLRGLIKLAAAGVKVRQGNPRKAVAFAAAAAREFETARGELEPDAPISIDGLLRMARHVRERAPGLAADPSRPVEVVFETSLASCLETAPRHVP